MLRLISSRRRAREDAREAWRELEALPIGSCVVGRARVLLAAGLVLFRMMTGLWWCPLPPHFLSQFQPLELCEPHFAQSKYLPPPSHSQKPLCPSLM